MLGEKIPNDEEITEGWLPFGNQGVMKINPKETKESGSSTIWKRVEIWVINSIENGKRSISNHKLIPQDFNKLLGMPNRTMEQRVVIAHGRSSLDK